MSVATQDPTITSGEHAVHFYEHDSELAETVARYLLEVLEAGGTGVVIATDSHRAAFEAKLAAAGVDVASVTREGRLMLLDAARTMDTFIAGEGRINVEAFEEVIGGTLRRAADAGNPVRAYGEMVALLWDAGDVLTAIELEKLWNGLLRELDFSLLCAYHSQSVTGAEHAEALGEVCHLHSSVTRAPGSERSAQFAPTPDAAGAARWFVADALRQQGHGEAMVEDARLVASELVANAVLHAGTPFSVTVRTNGGAVRVSVSDDDLRLPALQDLVGVAISGRGLRLVAALASDWGTEPSDAGKTVWAELEPAHVAPG